MTNKTPTFTAMNVGVILFSGRVSQSHEDMGTELGQESCYNPIKFCLG